MSENGAPPQFRIDPAREQEPIAQPPFQQWTFPGGTPWTAFHRDGAAYLLRFPGLADFAISPDGGSVRAVPVPGVQGDTIEHLFRNQVMPLALSRMARLVLHASAVAVPGGCAAFLGASGRGKSTLAASFATAGAGFLTDDGLQLEWRNGRPFALPSHASIRLWEDSQQALAPGHSAAAASTGKLRLLAGPAIPHSDAALPVLRMYVLGSGGPAIDIAPVPPSAAVVELVRHSFLLDIDEQQMLAWHFDEIHRIAAKGILYHLDYPRRYDALPAVREAILNHAIRTTS